MQQRSAGDASADAIVSAGVHDRAVTLAPGSGRPLEPAIRRDMAQRFDHDFSGVRVHADGPAARDARTRGAMAYTVGADIAFAPGEYRPRQASGLRLLAHELAHVVQQSRGGPAPGPAQERDADAASSAVSSGRRVHVQAPSAIGLAAQPAPPVADTDEYVPITGAPDSKPLPETTPEVLGRTDLDHLFKTNTQLRKRVEKVAKELRIDPGLLAAELLAEEGASAWSGSSGTVPSEVLGLDDWFGKDEAPKLQAIIAAHPSLGLKYDDVHATGEQWDTSKEKKGGKPKPRGLLDADKAVAAFGFYFKMQEKVLRDAIRGKGPTLHDSSIRTLEDLTPEQRLTVLRVGLNSGVGTGVSLFLQIAQGGDIPRSGKNTRDPDNASRTAVLHMARAIHLAQTIFGRSPDDYRPPTAAPITNQEAAEIFDHPELKKLPGYVVPRHY